MHSFVRECATDDELIDEDTVETNRQIMRYLAKAAGREGLEQMEKFTANTVLHVVCDLLTDLSMVDTVVSMGVDVNSVRNDDKLPLAIINAKLELDPDNDVLFDIKELLERKGAKTDWRQTLWFKKNYFIQLIYAFLATLSTV